MDLTPEERCQLGALYDVDRFPLHAGYLNGKICDRLVELGLATKDTAWDDIWMTNISPEGIKEAERKP